MRNLYKSPILLTIIAVLSLTALKAEAALLVASRGSNTILRYDDKTGDFIDAFIPPGSGGLDGPSYVVYGPDDNLYVADYYNSRVLRYNSKTGDFIDVFVPSDSGGLIHPETIEFGPDGDLYISGLDGNGLRRYDGKTGAFIDTVVASDPSTGNSLSSPNFTFGSNNDIYISSVFPTGGVLKYEEQTGKTSVFIPPSSSPEIPGGLTFGPDGNLYVEDFIPNASIRRYDGKTGALIDTFVPAGSGGLSNASRLIFRPDNYLYVTSFSSNSVLRYDAKSGTFIDAFIPSGSSGLLDPIGLTFTPTPVSVPEPTSYVSILGIGAFLGANLVLKSKKKAEISQSLERSVARAHD
jgi:streptogramin lyase